MNKLTSMLERQSTWQRSRAGMSWTDKLRLAGELRKAAIALRGPATKVRPRVAEERVSYEPTEKAD